MPLQNSTHIVMEEVQENTTPSLENEVDEPISEVRQAYHRLVVGRLTGGKGVGRFILSISTTAIGDNSSLHAKEIASCCLIRQNMF